MAGVPESKKSLIQKHLNSGEEAVSAYSDEDNGTMVLTENRLLVIEEGGQEESLRDSTETFPLGQTSGVKVDVHDPSDANIILGILAGIIGIGGLAAFFSAGSGGGSVQVGLGFIGVIFGIVLAAIAFDTDEGYIALTVHQTGSAPEQSYELSRDAEDFATGVSRHAVSRT